LTALGDDELLARLAALRAERLNLLDDVQAVDDLAEDNVLAIEPRGRNSGDEELRTVGVRAGIGHRQETGLSVLELEILVFELVAVNAFTASSVLVGEVTALQHEVWDNSVEWRVLVAESLLAGSQSSEVLSGLGGHILEKLEGDSSKRLLVGGDIEINSRVGHLCVLCKLHKSA